MIIWKRIGDVLRPLAGLVVPAQCPACRRRVARPGTVCRRCAGRLGREIVRPLRVRLAPSGSGACGLRVSSLGPLRGAWGRIVRAYKEDPAPMVAGLVEPLLAAAVRAQALRRERDGGEGEVPVLVPVPMAGVRRRQRGFNPPEHLARSLAMELGWAWTAGGLRRTRYRRPLRGLSAHRRREEMVDAFTPGPDASGLRGRRVLLLDDVLTTGATLTAAAQALRGLGVRVEGAWTLGRTPRNKKPQRGAHRALPQDGTCFGKSSSTRIPARPASRCSRTPRWSSSSSSAPMNGAS